MNNGQINNLNFLDTFKIDYLTDELIEVLDKEPINGFTYVEDEPIEGQAEEMHAEERPVQERKTKKKNELNELLLEKQLNNSKINKKFSELLEYTEKEFLDPNWSGFTMLTELFTYHLFYKYKHYDNIFTGNISLNITTFSDFEFPINNDNDNDIYLNKIINNILKGSEILYITLFLIFADNSSHQNVLLYRRESNTIEDFEPNGILSIPILIGTNSNVKNETITQDIIDQMIKINVIDKINERINPTQNPDQMIKYLSAKDNSINFPKKGVFGIGCQAIECSYKNDLVPSEIITGFGYCAAWSLFFIEMSLNYKHLNVKELNRFIFNSIKKIKKNKKYNTIEEVYKYIIRGYAIQFIKIMNHFFKHYLKMNFSFENYKKVMLITGSDSIQNDKITDTFYYFKTIIEYCLQENFNFKDYKTTIEDEIRKNPNNVNSEESIHLQKSLKMINLILRDKYYLKIFIKRTPILSTRSEREPNYKPKETYTEFGRQTVIPYRYRENTLNNTKKRIYHGKRGISFKPRKKYARRSINQTQKYKTNELIVFKKGPERLHQTPYSLRKRHKPISRFLFE